MLTFVQNLSNTMNDKEKLSYSLGMNIAGSLEESGV
jgi:hypothetical protein